MKKRTLFLKLLMLFLVMTLIVELMGVYLSRIKKPNFWMYHFYTVFEYFTLFYLFKSVLKDKKTLKFSYILLFLLVVVWCVTFVNRDYFNYAVIIGSFNVGVLVFLYLQELLLSDEIINYKRLLPFWVSVGLIVFHLPAIPFFSFWNYMKNKDLLPILHSLIVLMNIIISFGLIWSNKKVEY
ncbi:hypothetical protein [Tenacibaculum litoreum]|uniref:hypothetical protein n=1 Tax=Tenacibaculum litoreum TaxID=321269 RepID=UPI0038B610B0